MKSALLLVTMTTVLGACQPPPDAAVVRSWVRLAAVPDRPSAAYFTITGGARDETLSGISSPAVMRTEMHESITKDGTTSMNALKLVAIRSGSTVTFAPNGKHVMLYGLKPDVKAGNTMPLTFSFASGRTITARARIVRAGDTAPSD